MIKENSRVFNRGKVYVVLPAFNEAPNLKILIPKIGKVLQEQQLSFEIVVVNDGSLDATEAVLHEMKKHEMPLHIITHLKNQGLGGTLRDGLRYVAQVAAPHDIIFTLDADNSHSPEHFPEMVKLIQQGYDLVIASRYQSGSEIRGVPSHRLLLSYGARFLFQAVFPLKGVRDYTCGYRAYRATLLQKAFEVYGTSFVDREGFEVMVDVLLKIRKLKPKCQEIPLVLRYDQKLGVSKMRVVRTIRRTLNLVFLRKLRTV